MIRKGRGYTVGGRFHKKQRSDYQLTENGVRGVTTHQLGKLSSSLFGGGLGGKFGWCLRYTFVGKRGGKKKGGMTIVFCGDFLRSGQRECISIEQGGGGERGFF